jgi:hypothetical protein
MTMPSYAWGQDDRHAIEFELHLNYELHNYRSKFSQNYKKVVDSNALISTFRVYLPKNTKQLEIYKSQQFLSKQNQAVGSAL